MTTIISSFPAQDDKDIRFEVEANDADTDSINIEIGGESVTMPLADLVIAVDFMERASKAVREAQ
jgi:hypothetical protein